MKNEKKFDIKAEMIKEKDNILNQLISNTQRIVDLLKKSIPYKVLGDVLSYFKSLSLNINTEFDATGENVEAKFALELVQVLLTSIKTDDFENKCLEENELFEIINCSKEIFSLQARYLMAIQFENEDKLPKDYSDYIFSDFLRAGITGKRYDIFEIIHHKDILCPLSKYFEKCYGFEIDKVFEGLEQLKEEFTFGLGKTIEEFRKFIDTTNPEALTDEEQERGKEIVTKFLGLELHNVGKITNWTEDFIKAFASELGENNTFINNINFESIITLYSEINKKPIIKINENYYCPQIQRLLDNFDKILIKDMCKRLPNEAEEIRSILANISEKIAGELIKKIIPDANIYYKNYYKEKGNQFIENDVLIEYDNNLIVIEVKSGSFTPDLAINNMDSHLNALKKLIEEANTQSNRLIQMLKNKGQLDIYDDNKKGSKIKKTLNYNDYNSIFKIAVTLDGFNEVEARAEKIGFLNLNDGTIIVSIDDLRVYSDYFVNSPSLFLHYLKQRVLATGSKGINLNDELDHLGLYITYNTYAFWSDAVSRQYKTTSILWSGYREEIDNYYNQKYLKRKEVDKPVQKIPFRIEEIICFGEKNKILNHTQLNSLLLDLEKDKQRTEVNDGIDMMINFFKNMGRPKYAHFKGFSNLFITCIYNNLNYDISTLYKDAYANMKVSCIDEMTIAFLYYDKDNKLEKISCELLKIDNMPFDDTQLEEAINTIKERRINSAKTNRKIGRNEPCPCGSGKKYKKCCLK